MAVAARLEHSRELARLARRPARLHCNTPWGLSQGATIYAEGVVAHTTAGHGGFKLSAKRNVQIHTVLRRDSGFYEEDAEWAIVALTFPDLFTAFERKCADKTIRDCWPDAWEAIFGRSSLPVNPWRKIAARGGRRDHGVEERRFLVPSADYKAGCFGFVINESGTRFTKAHRASRHGREGCRMTSRDHHVALRRMEDACRQTRHQIDMIERQIIRKMTALIPSLGRRRPGYRGRPPERHAFLNRYRTGLAAITTERQPEIDALSRKLARQEAAIASLRARAPLLRGSGQTGGASRR